MDAAEEHPVNVAESSESPAIVATTSSTARCSSAGPLSRHHDDPPCRCWQNRIPKEMRVTQAPVPLNLALSPVWAELGRGIKALHSIISLIKHGVDNEDPTIPLPSDVRDTFSSHRETVTNSFEAVMVIITTTPGFVCKPGSAEHERRYAARLKALTDIENELTRSIKDAEPLFKARDELVIAETRYRRRRYIQSTLRTMSIVTIPFSPFVSAIFTAADVFGISVIIAIQRIVFPDADDQLGDTLQRVISLEKAIQHKVAEVKRLKANLEAVKAKLEEERRHPIASQLADILEKISVAKHAVTGALSPPCDKCACAHVAVPIRDVAVALQEVSEALEAPTIITGRLVEMSEAEYAVIDRVLAVLRTSSPTPAPATSSSD